ncbi:PilS cassette [Neisseria meningitidis serogroup B]|uniref:PilS cassette n=1 Tax=Neisseria meningitidis serogroup B TaxID=491 RepID=A0A0H5QCX0_NEIMI|nr:PilS cassette [Neisseria meningitidis serogroup B]
MTETPEILDSHFRGNDVVQVSVWMDSSFPRKRESRPLTRRESIGND